MNSVREVRTLLLFGFDRAADGADRPRVRQADGRQQRKPSESAEGGMGHAVGNRLLGVRARAEEPGVTRAVKENALYPFSM